MSKDINRIVGAVGYPAGNNISSLISSIRRGMKIEQQFRECASEWYDIQDASDNQDKTEHWDMMLYHKLCPIKVDVKAAKRLSRSDPDVQYDYIFIELKNVSGGPGWIYGKADMIAFEMRDRWVVVNRKELLDIVNELITDEYVDNPRDCLYKKYSRKGRDDLLTLIKASDLDRCRIKYEIKKN